MPSTQTTPFRLLTFLIKESLFVPLALMLLAGLIIVHPWGNFPIVDDYFHARVLRDSIAQGVYAKHPFVSVSLIAVVAWALPFALAFGDSYNVLRVSTLILAVVGAWAVARTAKACGAPRWAALTAGAALLFNPVYYTLSYSFMSDVPHIAAAALALLCFVRALQAKSPWWIVAGTAMSTIAFFCRQPGLSVLLAFWCVVAIAAVMSALRAFKKPHIPMADIVTIPMVGALLVSSAGTAALLTAWVLRYPYSSTQNIWFDTTGMWTPEQMLQYRIWFVAVAMAYMGMFAAPLVIARAQAVAIGAERWPAIRWVLTGTLFAAIAVMAITLTPGMTRMPYLSDYLYDLGVGNLTFTGTALINKTWRPFSIGPLWWPLTFLAWAGGALLTADVFGGLTELRQSSPEKRVRAVVILFLAGVMAAFILNNWIYLERSRFERYSLPALVPACVLLSMNLGVNRLTKTAGAVTMVLLAAATLILQQDYFAMTTARWDATHWLLDEHGADPRNVDGGYEYNGVYTMDEYVAQTQAQSFDDRGPSGYWVLGDQFVIDLLPRDGYQTIYEQPYFSWLGFETRRILVLEKIPAESPR